VERTLSNTACSAGESRLETATAGLTHIDGTPAQRLLKSLRFYGTHAAKGPNITL
jgi:hypothetical protein